MKRESIFDGKLKGLWSQRKVIETFSPVNTKATEASYRMALSIAKADNPHNTDETLLQLKICVL